MSLFRGRVAALCGMALAALLAAPGAQAQRGTAGPIYQPNIDALIAGGEDWLARLEQQGWFLRGQFTGIVQAHPSFRSPYRGPASLSPKDETRNTQSIDIVLGRRLWDNAEIVAVPSLTRGFGLSNSVGVANFPNGEAFRLGTRDPSVWLSRLFVRQTIDLSGDTVLGTDPDPMRFTGPLARERITLTAGRVSVWDFFDDNRYAHDARTQFMGWGQVGAGAFDFAADARGFTDGLVAEWENGTWAIRTGAFRVAREANSLDLEPRWLKGWQILAQVERAWTAGERPGMLRVLGGLSRTRSARWDALTGAILAGDEDTERLRASRTKQMLALNLEQELTRELGAFARLGWNDGRAQNWMFTEMDWSVSGGLSLTGQRWERPGDTVGLAFNLGGLSSPHRRFLEAGGIGFITGDGRLNYAPETTFETYYDARLAPGLNLALDAQLVVNPAYNTDRGPVPIVALRLHAAF
ncbi:carbohydrate porin [Paracraurococcus lichenis]|uniref:Carbohydrate porin n=1 Tax=Paracraurococcus lichenis TaxID=3064888 RepID=A0ABT9DXJ7_9PROT|nr:carbohydrate porin [Paracraurococcus sp. LOR1-02]MDO9708604.1 carbohydrate porin [Paracraurococcus sp. LOR1-02]